MKKTDKKVPFYSWLDDQDNPIRYMISARLRRLGLWNFSNSKALGDGICELKIDSGPGYRIYYAMVGITLVLILCAGDKKTQSKDIEKAKEYLKDYKLRGKAHGKK